MGTGRDGDTLGGRRSDMSGVSQTERREDGRRQTQMEDERIEGEKRREEDGSWGRKRVERKR